MSPIKVNHRIGVHLIDPHSPHMISKASWPVAGEETSEHDSNVPLAYPSSKYSSTSLTYKPKLVENVSKVGKLAVVTYHLCH